MACWLSISIKGHLNALLTRVGDGPSLYQGNIHWQETEVITVGLELLFWQGAGGGCFGTKSVP
jgi:hypothetical protein